MPERQGFAAKFKTEGQVRYPVLTDIDNGYALSLNLAIWVGDEMQKILQQGNNAWMLPIPATFVVAQDGIITARFIDPDYRKRMAIEDLLFALRSAQSQGESSQ
jgi:peroxiredoxin